MASLVYGTAANSEWRRELRKILRCRVVGDLWNTGLLTGRGHAEGLSKHSYIVFSTKKWITFAVHE